MEIAAYLVAGALIVLLVTAVSDRLEVASPLALIAVGVGLSYLPGMPDFRLQPEVVLLGLLPPLLYSTSITSSLVDFNANRRSILLLSVGLVLFTTFGVGVLVHASLPGTGWGPAIAIGAVVAPPDAVAASAIARRIGLPRRVTTILEGESLLNDATALVALNTAIAAASFSMWRVGLDFVLAAGGGAAVGIAVYLLVGFLRKHITDTILDTALSFVIPYAAYVVAEEIHASGVLAVVVAGLLLGHNAPVLQTAQSRIAERINWRTIAFLLENAVFLLIGLQASRIFGDVGDSDVATGRVVLVCGATLAAVVLLRLVWVYPARFFLVRPGPDPTTGQPPPWGGTFLLGWAGMRGVVTLAAAFVIPEHTHHREILLLIAFTVVAGTLFLQGTTLPLIARRLRIAGPDPMDDALARATLLQQASKAGFKALKEQGYEDALGIKEMIRQRIEQRNFAAWERLGTTADQETPSELYARTRLTMIDAERRRVLDIRSTGNVASEVVTEVLAMLDLEESMIDRASDARAEIRGAQVRTSRGEECDHLLAHAPIPPRESDAEETLTCARCIEDHQVWVALRQCLDCGNIGCCDSSEGRHATEHFRNTLHPVMQSAEPGEDWRWCYVHHLSA